MKYTIEGFSQEKAIEYGLDIEDLIILRWFVDFSPKMSQKQINDSIYYWINYQAILKDLPILGFKTKDRLYRKLKVMVEKDILKHVGVKNKDGSFSYYAFSTKYEELVGKNTEPYGKNTVPRTLKITEQNNSSTLDINKICPSEELADNFDKIWQIYPRKDGKNTAFKHYKAWLKGKEYAGRTVKLTNKQMWYAVKKYADSILRNRTEKQYIKMGSTFFNEAIMEYVEEENE